MNNLFSFLKPLLRELRFFLIKDKGKVLHDAQLRDAYKQWNDIINNSKSKIESIKSEKSSQNILFVTGYGLGAHFMALEPLIIASLLSRGSKVSVLYCNQSLPACEFNAVGNNIPQVSNDFLPGIRKKTICATCTTCSSNINYLYGLLPIDIYGYDSYLEEADYSLAQQLASEVSFENFRDFKFNGIGVGEEAYASILRVTFMGEVKESSTNRFLVNRYLISGILTSIAYERAYNEIKPDRIVCIHGVYQIHGLAVKLANKLNIPVVVLGGGGIRKDTVVVCHNESYHHQLVNESNNLWKQFNLTDADIFKTLNYAIKKRNSGNGADYLSYHPNPIENVDVLYDYCKIDKSRKIVSLYTNVVWDAQIFYSGNAFKDIFDWLFTSIEELGKNENIWVVIRIHPAEAKGGLPTKQPMLDEIKNRFSNLPSNVRIIPPESDISSYTLASVSAVNIIYGTKMGLEIALMKRPLVVCGETFSRNKGYGLDIKTKEQYIDLVKDIENYEVDNEANFKIAVQYAHYFYFRKMIDLPISTISTSDHTSRKIMIDSLNDLDYEKNIGIDIICNGILNGTDFYIGAEII